MFTNIPKLIVNKATLPTLQLLSPEGVLSFKHSFPESTLHDCLTQMIRLRVMDSLLLDAQRQGRLSFYMTSTGEEAIHYGTALALRHPHDPIFAQYREMGLLMARGFPLRQLLHQMCGNWRDWGRGRQMPIHFGSAQLNIQTISSPLGTQLPQAVGAAYYLKQQVESEKERGKISVLLNSLHSLGVPVCLFGEGAASEGDAHAAFNFASVLKTPLLFICRNNGFAISTPTHEQYAGDGIAGRALGYGIPVVRVDGNDLFAVAEGTRLAREHALSNSTPVLVEAMTLRVGHHSTSDDSSAYRHLDTGEVRRLCPIERLKLFLGVDEASVKEITTKARAEVLEALQEAEREPLPPIKHLFTDVYDELTPELSRQQSELQEHLSKYPQKSEGYKQE